MLVVETSEKYRVEDAGDLLTPALLIYPDIVDANIRATLRMAAGDPNRWRPHIKTTKIPAVLRQLLSHEVRNFKCATTLELRTACQAGAADVLLAYAVMGANARRTQELSQEFPATRISVLIESPEQAAIWRGTKIGLFIDVNPGMNRTGINEDHIADIVQLVRSLGEQFRGLHYYDGHIGSLPADQREKLAHDGYARLLKIVAALRAAQIPIGEVITSGTPAAPYAMSYAGFRDADFLHRMSPGTVVYNDMTSMEQLGQFGYQPAALVLSTVVSRPTPQTITCDAGHKSVSADAGVPTCRVVGHGDWQPAKPSEEHLPIEIAPEASLTLGDRLYLVPRHVCPTVNNFDEALLVVDGKIQSIERVAARGHESPVATAAYVK